MKITKAEGRDKKYNKRNRMVVNGKSIFVIQNAIINRANKVNGKGK